MLVALWGLSLVILLFGIGHPPVTRTQEARVLETARQMLGTGFDGWMEPTLNGQPRMKKPPLCYWMTAFAYKIGGISEGVGRIPTAILGWLTLGVVYVIGLRLFDQRTAVYCCTVLLGSMYFYRFSRLAETDPAVMCFLTIAVYFLLRTSESRSWVWPHLAALSVGMVVLSKGAPAIFAALFLVFWCFVERRGDVLKRFAFSGAPLTLAIIAIPWFLMVPDESAEELANTLLGRDHFEWPWNYVPYLFVATLPWSIILPVAVYSAAKQWKTHPGIRLVAIWLLSVLIPLCINGNKQHHYLVMLLPPLMMLIGVFLANVPTGMERLARVLLILTAAGCVLGAIAGPGIMASMRGMMLPIDLVAAGALLGTALLIGLRWRGGLGRVIPGTLVAGVLLMPILVGFWFPTSNPYPLRDSAIAIQRVYQDRDYVFFGDDVSIVLSFYLRDTMPLRQTPAELIEHSGPGTVAIAILPTAAAPLTPPEPFEHRLSIDDGRRTLAVYERR